MSNKPQQSHQSTQSTPIPENESPPVPNFIPPPQVEPISAAELDRLMKEAKTTRVYPMGGWAGPKTAEHFFMADVAEAAGLHAMAADLRGQYFDTGYVAGAKRLWNAPLTPKTIGKIILIGGIAYVAYSGIAWVFRIKGGLFGKRAEAIVNGGMQFPQPM